MSEKAASKTRKSSLVDLQERVCVKIFRNAQKKDLFLYTVNYRELDSALKGSRREGPRSALKVKHIFVLALISRALNQHILSIVWYIL